MPGASVNLRRKIGAERILLMLPINVVLVGRVRGHIDASKVSLALELLRRRHPLLAVRAQIDEDGTGWYVNEGVPQFTVHVEPRRNGEQWIARVKKELRTPFPIETGPLVRCALIHSRDTSEIVLCGHHAVCDGMSLGYLLRDLLELLSGSQPQALDPVEPPAIDSSTVPKPPAVNWFLRFLIGMINKKWAKKRIRFGEGDMRRMHAEFWKRNDRLELLAWRMDPASTAALVQRCRGEKVTVNAALWTAFLAAQHDVQGNGARFRERSALAVNTRDRLKVPAGESFGFYASSLTVRLPYDAEACFWDNARRIHAKINDGLSGTNLFRMLFAETIHPTLLDSLYFSKYGLLDETMPKRLLRKMGWHQVTYGYALTNVGRFDVATSFGPLRLEAVYGPAFYSDVEEKIVGVITVGGALSCILSYNQSVIADGTALKEAAIMHLDSAIGRGTWQGNANMKSRTKGRTARQKAC